MPSAFHICSYAYAQFCREGRPKNFRLWRYPPTCQTFNASHRPKNFLNPPQKRVFQPHVPVMKRRLTSDCSASVNQKYLTHAGHKMMFIEVVSQHQNPACCASQERGE